MVNHCLENHKQLSENVSKQLTIQKDQRHEACLRRNQIKTSFDLQFIQHKITRKQYLERSQALWFKILWVMILETISSFEAPGFLKDLWLLMLRSKVIWEIWQDHNIGFDEIWYQMKSLIKIYQKLKIIKEHKQQRKNE